LDLLVLGIIHQALKILLKEGRSHLDMELWIIETLRMTVAVFSTIEPAASNTESCISKQWMPTPSSA
jgi:hypothetical protein